MLALLALQVDFDDLCYKIAFGYMVKLTAGICLWTCGSQQPRHPWGTAEWAGSTAKAQDAISSAIADHLDVKRGCKPYQVCIQAFQLAFAKDTPMQLSRFQTLQTELLANVLPEAVQQALSAAAPTVERMKQLAFDDMFYNDVQDTFAKLSRGIRGCVTDQIYRRLSNPLELSSQLVLEEAAEWQAWRAELHHQLQTLQTAKHKISSIHETVRTQTTFQKDLLGSPASSKTASNSLETTLSDLHLSPIEEETHCNPDGNHTPHRGGAAVSPSAALPQDAPNAPFSAPKQPDSNAPCLSTDSATEEWSHLSPASLSAAPVQLDTTNDPKCDKNSPRTVPR